MKHAILTAVIALAPTLAAAEMTETTVIIERPGQDVIGTLALPAGDPAPAVLLLHGFTGSRHELMTEAVPEGVFARTAARLADAGYASLRIDFAGSGEATDEMSFAETTFEGQIGDALAAVEYLRGLDSIDTEDLFLIGWSQGGLVAAATAGRSDAFDAVALWNAVATPRETYSAILTEETVAAGLAAGPDEPVPVTLPWAEITLNGAFFQGLETLDPVAEIAPYDGPLFVAQGSLDTTVPPASADLYIAAHDGEEDLWTAEMDHVFNIFATGDVLEELIAANIAYFDAHAD
ncbi:alpha/beta fold hydrolase [Roseibacterium sp. SDUM158016]|uniref:alpha/beta hydrolase family protein n=1 Tax=Roseicyclus sediminis TaxID=2980997 RepID=UPI0021CF7272|nr:alpha/beta fold hydrolase [Roseibacterium sp. SDUM158016]MCU4651604.1 alpha/beta fold hydrolase [Roseibacterium sp. SDUM158016]